MGCGPGSPAACGESTRAGFEPRIGRGKAGERGVLEHSAASRTPPRPILGRRPPRGSARDEPIRYFRHRLLGSGVRVGSVARHTRSRRARTSRTDARSTASSTTNATAAPTRACRCTPSIASGRYREVPHTSSHAAPKARGGRGRARRRLDLRPRARGARRRGRTTGRSPGRRRAGRAPPPRPRRTAPPGRRAPERAPGPLDPGDRAPRGGRGTDRPAPGRTRRARGSGPEGPPERSAARRARPPTAGERRGGQQERHAVRRESAMTRGSVTSRAVPGTSRRTDTKSTPMP